MIPGYRLQPMHSFTMIPRWMAKVLLPQTPIALGSAMMAAHDVQVLLCALE
jgi:hypothetical protein